MILSLVSAGLGVSLIPQPVTGSMPADLRLHPVAAPPLSRKVSAAVHAGSARTPSIAVLLARLREAAAQPGMAGT